MPLNEDSNIIKMQSQKNSHNPLYQQLQSCHWIQQLQITLDDINHVGVHTTQR